MYRECKACKGECVQTRNDGIVIECPSCDGTGHREMFTSFYITPQHCYEKPQEINPWISPSVYTGDLITFHY